MTDVQKKDDQFDKVLAGAAEENPVVEALGAGQDDGWYQPTEEQCDDQIIKPGLLSLSAGEKQATADDTFGRESE